MDHSDLYLLRETYNQKRLVLCFNGPFSQGLIEELGLALRSHLQSDSVSSAAASDVFAVYIELTQNIRHYARHNTISDEAGGTVAIGRDEQDRHIILAGNVVEPEDGRALQERVRDIAGMDKAQLRAAYKEQLRRPREEGSASGAGLGLLDIARKSSEVLSCSLLPVNSGNQLFFSIKVVI
ncbi:hypothetical protein IAD21_04640 [Abditibacteriota bacterium]|nr:hypothetical protein IAD21_04640 [Abditibacteriota bacterium]